MRSILLKTPSLHGIEQYRRPQATLYMSIYLLSVFYCLLVLTACSPSSDWQRQATMLGTLQQTQHAICAHQWQLAQIQLAQARAANPDVRQHAIYWSYLAAIENALTLPHLAVKHAWRALQLAPHSFISNNNYAVILCQISNERHTKGYDKMHQLALAHFNTMLHWHDLSIAKRHILNTNLKHCQLQPSPPKNKSKTLD